MLGKFSVMFLAVKLKIITVFTQHFFRYGTTGHFDTVDFYVLFGSHSANIAQLDTTGLTVG